MNISDSERIAAILKLAKIMPAKNINEADLLIINSCSVRQSAINRIYGQLINFRKINKSGKTILTGCLLESDKKKLKDKFDLIIDIKELTSPKNDELKKLLKLLNPDASEQEFKAFDYTDYFRINPQYQSNFSAYIPIMTGCNNFCSYCAVPYTRGREISRPAKEIIKEVKRLIGKGYKEITLLGQNVNSYKSIENKKKPVTFPQLLKLINAIPGNFWIRFLTSHPKDMSDELIRIMAKSKKICEYVHLPIQAGDDKILEKMNRRYTSVQYLKLINKIKKTYQFRHYEEQSDEAISKHKNSTRDCFANARNDKSSVWNPPIAISTDIIVGFPGETKAQFANTAKIMRSVKYDMAYLAQYSPRTGTAAAKLKDNVPITEKKRRKEFLNDILRKTALANNKKYVGKIVEVLIEKLDGGFAAGKTRTFKNVRIAILSLPRTPLGNFQGESLEGKLTVGQFAKIKITQASAWGLEGKFVE